MQAAIVGSIAGFVRDEGGIPQMGAVVTLMSPQGRVAKRVYSDPRGAFRIEGLFPGQYSIKVALERFLPVLKEKVAVEPGGRTFLDIQLIGLFSSLQLVFPGRSEIRDMTDDWKWVLRTSSWTRPVLRFRPQQDRETQAVLRKLSGTFSNTRAYAELSAGGGAGQSALANRSDLGTAFAVATSLFGNNNLTVSGNLGYGSTQGTPLTAFRTSYSRELGLGEPEVSVTVRQLQVPVAARQAVFGPQQDPDNPALQTVTLGFADKVELGDLARVEYGFVYESVTFLNRLNFVSPYGRLVSSLGENRELHLRYASGLPPAHDTVAGAEALRYQVSSLGLFPRLSLRDGRPTVQRTEHLEIAYREKMGEGLLEVAAYRDSLSDAAVSALVPAGHYAQGNVLPDLFSNSSTLNGGRHRTTGYRVSYARKIREKLQAAVGYGLAGVVSSEVSQLESPDPQELRGALNTKRAHLLMASVSTQLPKTNSRVVSTYQWVSRPFAIAPDVYNDFAARSDPGWNIIVRQPLPFSGSLPGKLEATADFRNLLKAGYIPIQTFDGQQMYLIPAVRSYRGALSFIF